MINMLNAGLFFFSFIVLWVASNMMVSGILHFARRFNMSSFSTSFFILGILTSIPEFSVGLNAISDRQPFIFTGNLIGASITLFAFAIPLLAIFGRKVRLKHELPLSILYFALFIIVLPAFFALGGSINRIEALTIFILYILLFYFIEKKKSLGEKIHDMVSYDFKKGIIYAGKIILGMILLFFASRIIVSQTEYFSSYFNITPFVMGLVLLGLGTNLPEFSVAIQSIVKKHEEVAFGDYIGSAAANSFFFSILCLMYGPFTLVGADYLLAFTFLAVILGFFALFIKTNNSISAREGLFLVFLYCVFILIEIY